MQPSTVDDAHASMVFVPAGGQEVLDRSGRFRCFHPVQIPAVARDVIAPLQFSDLAPIHARRDEIMSVVILAGHVIACAGRRRRRRTRGGSQARGRSDAAAWIWCQRNHVGHLTGERVRIGG
jgi:hypothetical protein